MRKDKRGERIMKTQEELRQELLDQTDGVHEAIGKLKKASFILNHWEEEYGFTDRPNPKAAIAWGSSIRPEKSIAAEQSFKWFYEYNRIYEFIDIVRDYVFESKKLLEKATYGGRAE